MRIVATAESTGGAFGLTEAIGPAGSSPPLHIHHREDEAFWPLEGELHRPLRRATFTARPGSFTFLPRGVPHTFVVEGDRPARLLSICVPGGFEGYFAAAGQPGRGRRPAAGGAARRPDAAAGSARTSASRSSGRRSRRAPSFTHDPLSPVGGRSRESPYAGDGIGPPTGLCLPREMREAARPDPETDH